MSDSHTVYTIAVCPDCGAMFRDQGGSIDDEGMGPYWYCPVGHASTTPIGVWRKSAYTEDEIVHVEAVVTR